MLHHKNALHSSIEDPKRLDALARLNLLDTAPEESFDRLTRLAQRLLSAPMAFVSLVDHDRQFFKSAFGLVGEVAITRETPLSHSFCQHVVASRDPLVVTDATCHPVVGKNLAIRDLGVKSYLGVPLFSPDGFAVGSFCVIDTKPRAWTADDIATMQELGALVVDEFALRAAKSRQEADDERLRKIAFNVPGVVYQYHLRPDGTSHFPYASEGVRQIYGVSPEELVNDAGKVFAVLHPDDIAAVTESIVVSARTLQPWCHEYRVRLAGGVEHWLLGHAMPERTAEGGTMWHGFITNISERKLAEAKLRETEALFRTMADSAPVLIWLSGPDKACTYFNKVALGFLGRTLEQLQGDGWTDCVHPDDLNLCLETYTGAFAARRQFTMEYRMRRTDGEYRWLTDTGVPRFAEGGNFLGYIGCGIDVTESKRAEEERQQLEHKIQETQKLESLGVLAGGIAHDFNNILTSILGNASLASLDLPPGSPVQAYVESIKLGSQRAADLCRQMLAYSGKGRFVVANLSLNRLIEETTHLLELSINKYAILRFNLHPSLPAIEADGTQIRQVIMNLVINAAEAIGAKSGVISINTGLTRVDRAYLGGTVLAPEIPEGTYVYLEVSDSGCGMSPETQARIFDPFFTTKFAGRGLGLAAVLGIVRGHKGAVKIYSEPGRGTTFKLLFPCAAGGVDAAADSVPPIAFAPGQGAVLIVDDEESVRSTAALMLKRLGFEVALAADGREAVRIFGVNPRRFTLVLMDLTMPHLDGELAFGEMRRLHPSAQVILMSGFNEQEVISRFNGKGLAGFIQKPFPYETLVAIVQKAMARV